MLPLDGAAALKAIKDPVLVHDLKGRILFANQPAAALSGYKREELEGMNIRKLVSPGQAGNVPGRIAGIRRKGWSVFESEHRRKDGSILPVEARCGMAKLGGGRQVICMAHDITGRRKAEEELERYRLRLESLVEDRTRELKARQERLEESRADLHALTENTKDGIWSVDRDYRVLTANSAFIRDFREFFGGKLNAGGDILNIRARSQRSLWKARYDRAFDGEHFMVEECYMKRGRKKCLEVSFSPVLSGRTVIGAACFSRDVTARKAAEALLLDAEERSRLILKSSGEGIIGVDTSGRVLFANDAAQRMLGWTFEELRHKNLHAMIHHHRPDGSVYPIEACPMFAAYTRKTESRVEDELLWRKDGSRFFTRYSAQPMLKDGGVTGAVITFSDVTVRREAEEEVERQRARLESQNKMLMTLGRSKKLEGDDLQAAFREATEIAVRALDTERVSVWLFKEGRAELACRDLYERSTRAHGCDLSLRAKDYPYYFKVLEADRVIAAQDAAGDIRTKELRDKYFLPNRIVSVLDVSVVLEGKTVGIVCAEHTGPARAWRPDERNFIGAIADFIALAILTFERRNLEKMKELLTHTIIHDLNNPLTGVSTAAELIGEGPKNSLTPDQREALGIITVMSREMKDMISNILDISRMEEGKMPLKLEVLDPAAAAAEAVSSVALIARAGNKRIELVSPAGLGPVCADREILKRVLGNLLGNALKFAPRNSKIELNLSADGEFLASVSDLGEGIPEEYLSAIFEKFVQVENGKAYRQGGKGLGLTFCRLAVEAHGGRIWAENRPGGGAAFYFTLPLAAKRLKAKAACVGH